MSLKRIKAYRKNHIQSIQGIATLARQPCLEKQESCRSLHSSSNSRTRAYPDGLNSNWICHNALATSIEARILVAMTTRAKSTKFQGLMKGDPPWRTSKEWSFWHHFESTVYKNFSAYITFHHPKRVATHDPPLNDDVHPGNASSNEFISTCLVLLLPTFIILCSQTDIAYCFSVLFCPTIHCISTVHFPKQKHHALHACMAWGSASEDYSKPHAPDKLFNPEMKSVVVLWMMPMRAFSPRGWERMFKGISWG